MSNEVFLLLLILLVLSPLLLKNGKTAIGWVTSRGEDALDSLDEKQAPLPLRIVLRWTLWPAIWLAKQVKKDDDAIDVLDDVTSRISEMDPTERLKALDEEERA
jgi:hypothetical protein